MTRVRRERGYGVNPWSTHTRFLISHRLLIDEAYTGPLLDWLGAFRSGTLLILDEAHHAAPSSGQKYAIDSQITRAIRELAPRFEHRLFLSATPHNGHSNSFSALLEILDPQRFCRGVPVTKKMLDDVMVRRLKEDIREVGSRSRNAASSSWTLTVCRPTPPNFGCPPCWISTAAPRTAAEGRDQTQAGRSRAVDHRFAAAAAVLGRSVCPDAASPPRTVQRQWDEAHGQPQRNRPARVVGQPVLPGFAEALAAEQTSAADRFALEQARQGQVVQVATVSISRLATLICCPALSMPMTIGPR